VITFFQLIWKTTEISLVPNQSENCKHNLIFGVLQESKEDLSTLSQLPDGILLLFVTMLIAFIVEKKYI